MNLNTAKYFWLAAGLFMWSSCAKPLASFSIEEDQLQAPVTIQFQNNSEKAETYFWDFGDGHTSEEFQPDHRYILSGKYKVALTANKGKKQHIMSKEIIVEPPHDCMVEMETTHGTITLKLYDETPQHRDNFIKLAETEFYDGLLFHRVINQFMIQGGDPNSKDAAKGQRLGSGGPGYQVPAEFNKSLAHIKGAVAAARTSDSVNPQKMSSGSQFYIVHGRPLTDEQIDVLEAQKGLKYSDVNREILRNEGGTPFLDQEYTVFGQVVKGFDVLDKIAGVQTDGADRPIEDVRIIRVRAIK